MRYRGLIAALIGISALCMTGCGTSRQATKVQDSSFMFHGYETRDTVVEQVMVEVHDTIREVTTITVATNDAGDTLKVVQVTDRERAASRDRKHDVKEKVVVKTDTVYVAVRDSVSSSTFQDSRASSTRASPVVSALTWIFWIIIALTGLVVIIKIRRI